MGRRTRIVALIAGGGLMVGLGVGGARLWDVHQATADWAFWPKEVPSRVDFSGRSFDCGPQPRPSTAPDDGLTLRGHTLGGGDIYAASPRPGTSAVTSIVVQSSTGRFECGLMGGP